MWMKTCIISFWGCYLIFDSSTLIFCLPPSPSSLWWPLSCCRSTVRRPSAPPATESRKRRCQRKEKSRKRSRALRASGRTEPSPTSRCSLVCPRYSHLSSRSAADVCPRYSQQCNWHISSSCWSYINTQQYPSVRSFSASQLQSFSY